ncbi:MAG: dTDP-4-dehydrorhamnose reductase [Syntrophobacteraceae bacterium]|nr:dTDP-4-dehydrorhamnose reductase [Syntrophobacteraceae bacterium]
MSVMKKNSSGYPPVLVLGSRGMLGRDLVRRFREAAIPVVGFGLEECDITRKDRVAACVGSRPWGAVINCAAYTAVDQAESEPDLAFRVNRDGAANVADECAAANVPLIHLSTDHVFDGRASEPYREDEEPNPVNVYGQSKWEGETAVRSRTERSLIVRTAWLYGVHGDSFVTKILALARARDELRVIRNHWGCPTWTIDLADCLIRMVQEVFGNGGETFWGTYHFCGRGQASRFDFAQAILREGLNRERLKTTRILAVEAEEYPTPASRPPWAVLDCGKVERVFGIVPPDWTESLALMMDELYKSRFTDTMEGDCP